MSKIIRMWSDGGCRGNGKEVNIGAYAWHLEFWVNGELKATKNDTDGFYNTTNNKMELMGCIEGLKAIKNKNMALEVHLDSAYVLNGITSYIHKWKVKGWVNSKNEPVKNKELWMELDNEQSKFTDIKFIKVKGHSDDLGNQLVDGLLNETMNELEIGE